MSKKKAFTKQYGGACNGKRRYRDSASAKQVLQKAKNSNSRVKPVRWYSCSSCNGYHLTSQETWN